MANNRLVAAASKVLLERNELDARDINLPSASLRRGLVHVAALRAPLLGALVTVLWLTMSSVALAQVGLPAPMVYYRFDDVNLGLDSGTLHHDGQVLASRTAGVRGGAIATGATDGVLEFHANAPELNLLGAASVIAWVKPAGPHISDPSCHAGVVASKGGNLTLAVAQDNNELWYENEASGDGIVAAEGSTPVGSWTQIAITRDASGLVQFYRNGRPTGIPGTSAIGPISNDANFTIGYQFDDIPHHCEFNGAIDEVQVFNGKLSAAEIYVEYLAVVPLSVPLWGFGARAATGVGLLLLGLAFARRRVLGHVIRS